MVGRFLGKSAAYAVAFAIATAVGGVIGIMNGLIGSGFNMLPEAIKLALGFGFLGLIIYGLILNWVDPPDKT
jgi:hypothetical protein